LFDKILESQKLNVHDFIQDDFDVDKEFIKKNDDLNFTFD